MVKAANMSNWELFVTDYIMFWVGYGVHGEWEEWTLMQQFPWQISKLLDILTNGNI